MQGIAKQDLNKVLETLSAGAALLVPMEIDGVTRFALWEQGAKTALGAENTLLPPKDALFPQNEKVFNYEMSNEEAKILPSAPAVEETIILGIRPCDVRAIQALDNVFLTKDNVDELYKTRRDHTLLIALGCIQPAPTCFCSSVGGDPLQAEGADIMIWDLGETYGLEALTDKGKDLLKKIDKFMSKSGGKKPAAGKFALEVDSGGIAEKLHNMFEDPKWQRPPSPAGSASGRGRRRAGWRRTPGLVSPSAWRCARSGLTLWLSGCGISYRSLCAVSPSPYS